MVTLRAFKKSDRESLVALANNRNVSRYLTDTFPYPYTWDEADWWVRTGCREKGLWTRVIEHDGIFVGSIGISRCRGWKSHKAEIGYWVGEPYWGRGIATEALAAMTRVGFEELKFEKLFAPVLAPNRASARVLEKCGYFLEARLPREVYKDGICYDIRQFAKFRP